MNIANLEFFIAIRIIPYAHVVYGGHSLRRRETQLFSEIPGT